MALGDTDITAIGALVAPAARKRIERKLNRLAGRRQTPRRRLLIGAGALSGLAFAVGASLSSLSWQTLLAGIGAALHTRLTPRMELATALLSSAILVGFALKIALDALAR